MRIQAEKNKREMPSGGGVRICAAVLAAAVLSGTSGAGRLLNPSGIVYAADQTEQEASETGYVYRSWQYWLSAIKSIADVSFNLTGEDTGKEPAYRQYTLIDTVAGTGTPAAADSDVHYVVDGQTGKAVGTFSGKNAAEKIKEALSGRNGVTLLSTGAPGSSGNTGTGTAGTGAVKKTASAETVEDSGDSTGGPGGSTSASGIASALTESVGIEKSIDADTSGNGPSVESRQLTETYNDTFRVYSEEFNGWYIYANVGNNGFTDQPVYLDIPANISFSAARDGNAIAYTSKQMLHEYGSYVFRFSMMEDPNVPVARQKIYNAVFNFKIMAKPSAAAESGNTDSGSKDTYGYTGSGTTIFYPDGTTIQSDEAAAAAAALARESEAGTAAETIPETMPGTEPETAAMPDTESLPESGQEEMTEEAETAAPAETERKAVQTYTTVYKPDQAAYEVTLPEGDSFLVSVPNGMLTPYAVNLDFTGFGSLDRIKLLKDGDAQDISRTETLDQAGSYEILMREGTQIYTYCFRMPGSVLASMDYYMLPPGVTATEIMHDGTAVSADNGMIDFTGDGSYTLQLRDSAGSLYDLAFTIDHTAPAVSVEIVNHEAVLSYDSDDIAEVTLTDSAGKTETYSGAVTSVSTPGKYRITVTDQAGNSSSADFSVAKPFKESLLFSFRRCLLYRCG